MNNDHVPTLRYLRSGDARVEFIEQEKAALDAAILALTSPATQGAAAPVGADAVERVSDAMRALIVKWRTRLPHHAPSTSRVLMREHCADELEAALAAATQEGGAANTNGGQE